MTSFDLAGIEFSKYHGLGNDYIIIDNRDGKIPQEARGAVALELCKQHFGIGADGLVLVGPSMDASNDMAFSIINSDGSMAEMCGNGIRCFAKYLHDKGIVRSERMNIETLAGTKHLTLHVDGSGVARTVTVDMGAPVLDRAAIPVSGDGTNENIEISAGGKDLTFTAVSMGNPHAVFFMDEISVDEARELGPVIETHALFPKKVNVEFVKVLSPTEMDFLVWERGVGMTLACGTGACAAVVAGVLLGKLEKGNAVTVHLQGGDLTITYDGLTVLMDGPAVHSFDGTVRDHAVSL